MTKQQNTPKTVRTAFDTRQMALIGLMTAVICIIAPFSLTLPVSPVPVSLGTLAVCFAVAVLGRKRGTICVSLYLLLGLAGLPVFSSFTGGGAKLLGPTGGYLIGYLFMALICGFFVDKLSGKKILCFLGLLLGTAVCYLFGTLWLSYQANISFLQALTIGVLPFIPTDLIKILLAFLLSIKLRKALQKAGLLRA